MEKTFVVIPHYIVTEELKELATNTINSFRQSYPEAVIVSVDDGSPMDCTFLQELSDVYLRNEKNSGFAITCNNGFDWIFRNTTENCYIICSNNDIEINPGCIEELKFPFENLENVAVTGISHSRTRVHDGIELKDKKGDKLTNGGLNGECMQDGGLWMSTKEVLQKVGIFDEQFIRGGYEDVDLFLRMRDTFGMKIIMSNRKWYWHKEGATRWNCENNGYINNFGHESKSIEQENLQRFINKWGYNPHTRQIWWGNEIWKS
jgi:GT2 family glycosyltransferase